MSLRSSLLFLATCLMPHVAGADEIRPVAVGDKSPDFEVTGIDGKPFSLSERLADGERNIVLLFSRAHW